MNITTLFIKHFNAIEGNFDNLTNFSFCGVYVLCDANGEVVYVGSSYVRNIGERLKQYLSISDTGNTLGKTIAKSLANTDKFDDVAKERMKEAVEKIKTFKIYAIEHNDLEYKLVRCANPVYNNKGKAEN